MALKTAEANNGTGPVQMQDVLNRKTAQALVTNAQMELCLAHAISKRNFVYIPKHFCLPFVSILHLWKIPKVHISTFSNKTDLDRNVLL